MNKVLEVKIPLDKNLDQEIKETIILAYKSKLNNNVNMLGDEMRVVDVLWNDTSIILKCEKYNNL